MTNTYDTSNEPLGSTAVKVLYNNASNLDDAVNSEADTWVDRPPFGRIRRTWRGMENAFDQFLTNTAFELPPLVYVDGSPLQVDRATQLIERSGLLYSVKLPATFPVTLSGTWAADEPLLTVRNDQSLRQELADPSLGASLVALLNGGTLADINKIVTPAMKGAVVGADATVAIQAALDDPRPVLIITDPYKVNTETRLYPPSGKKIIFIGNGKLEALAATSAFYSIFDLENKTDIDFVNPVLIGDRDIHLGSGGEQGFGIRALSVKRIRVIGGDISKFWGDGLYFGATDTLTHTNCEDVSVIGVNSHHNRRQGMSLTGLVNGYFENCLFNDTNGTNPQSGVDIEPNAGFKCTDITFASCSAERNAGAGFELLDSLNNNNVFNINFIDCPARSNGSNGLRLVSAKKVTHTGEISANSSHGVYAIQGSTGLRLPAPDIHNNGGDGVQILTNSSGALIGAGAIYSNAGFGVQSNYKVTLDKVELYSNTLGGWYFGATSVRSQAHDCYVHDNGGTGGESAAGSSETLVSGGEYTSNSMTTNLAGHNLAIYGNNCQVLNGVKARVGVNPNKPAYGMRTTGNTGLVFKGNDFRGSGATGDIFQQTLTSPDVSDNFPYLRSGTTAQRPTQYLVIGQVYYDQSLGKPIWWFGSNWRDAAGTVV